MEASQFITGKPVDVGIGDIAVTRVLCPNAGVMTGPGTNTYLVGDKCLALIDPGPELPEHTSAILKALAGRPLGWIFVTHTHADHSPGTRALQAQTGARVIGLLPPSDAPYQDQHFAPDRTYHDNESTDCGDFHIRLIHTPGHVSNHACYLLEEDGLLFTGDHILQGTTPVILPPDGDMADYLNSLQNLQQLPLKALAPGHGGVIGDPARAIAMLVRHRQRREKKVLSAMHSLGPATADTLILKVYDDVAAHLLPWARKTLLAHLYKLRHEGIVVCHGADDGGVWSLRSD